MPVSFYSQEIDFKLKNQPKVKKWIKEVILTENKSLGNINYIFCSDTYLLSLNNQYLNHNTYTDIITFDYTENNTLSSDIFISIDRVSENSIKYSTDFNSELMRVIIHGVLHLIGFKDKLKSQKLIMRAKEDFYLNLLP
ncbi:MAG: rRNA maturation RNase YbeY [Flavobacteriales bacterium]|nr:rRNA maturation RNase YbeY [Flavobacteriales bacterium]